MVWSDINFDFKFSNTRSQIYRMYRSNLLGMDTVICGKQESLFVPYMLKKLVTLSFD